jgi:ferrous iron transport protein A
VNAGRDGAGDGAARGGGRAPRSLADLPVGGSGRVREVVGGDALEQRLLEMGLTPGTLLQVIRFAPLGDPLEVRVRGYLLSVRRHDARGVLLQEDPS